MRSLTLEEVVEKAFRIHGNRYTYFNFTTTRDKMTIRCNDCGSVFKQLPNNHLAGHGCPVCKGLKSAASQKFSLKDFINRSNDVHCFKYDYSKSIYIGSRVKLIITCHKHGDFEQIPANHLQGQGCPNCQASKGELIIKSLLEKHNIKHVQQFRIPEVINLLKYDFCLPEYNILLEFHGKQHFEYSPYFHHNGEDDFLSQKIRDELIRHNAYQFKYLYLEFNYKHLKKLGKHSFKKMVLKEITKFRKRDQHALS